MKVHAFRCIKGMDLKQSIINYQKEHNIQSGCILSCVGCLYQARIRVAGGQKIEEMKNDYEIVSLTGTLSENGVHLHISLSDENMTTIGGHLCDGCLVNTTAEIVLLEMNDEYRFTREFDDTTGYKEIVVEKR